MRGAGRELALVQTAGHGGQPNREWQFLPTRDGFFNIVARHSGLGMDIRDAAGEMALVQTAGLGGQPNREFAVIPIDTYEPKARFFSAFIRAGSVVSTASAIETCIECARDAGVWAIVGAPEGPEMSVILAVAEGLTDPQCGQCATALMNKVGNAPPAGGGAPGGGGAGGGAGGGGAGGGGAGGGGGNDDDDDDEDEP